MGDEMNTNEAILNKLIELGYLPHHYTEWDFNIACANDYIIVQRALFDEVIKRNMQIVINKYYGMHIINCCGDVLHQGDTSPESFRAAFEKVVGI